MGGTPELIGLEVLWYNLTVYYCVNYCRKLILKASYVFIRTAANKCGTTSIGRRVVWIIIVCSLGPANVR